MERGGLIKKTSLMQLFFKDKIYILNSNRYWFSVYTFKYYTSHCSIALRTRSKICKVCERDYRTVLTILFVWPIFISRHDSSIFLIFAHFAFPTYRSPRRTCSQFIPSSRFGQTTDLWIYRSTFEKIQYRENMGD